MANCVQCGRRLPPFSFSKICQWCVKHEAAQRGEEAEDVRQPVMPTPWVRRGESSITLTQVLFGANFAVFLAMAFASSGHTNFIVSHTNRPKANISAKSEALMFTGVVLDQL